MNVQRGLAIFVFSLMALFSIFETASADQVLLKNGDRITGSIVKKDGQNVTIKADLFGPVTVSWEQVESITADKPLTVVLQDGKTVQGTLTTSGGKVAVAVPNERLQVAPADIITLRNAEEQAAYDRLLNPGWGELWAGTAGLGFAGTAGNAKTSTFTGALAATRATNTDKTSIYFSMIKASALVGAVSADTAEAVRGGVGYNHNVSPRFFLNVFNDYEYDRFQNLDLRFVLGGGAGYNAIKNERSRLDLLAGADYNRSSFSTPLASGQWDDFTRDSAEFYWGDDYSLKLTGTTALVQSFRMFQDLNDTGIRRLNFDIGAVTKISSWLSWNLSVSDRYLSRPAPGRKSNDFLYSTGVAITFAR